MQSGRGSRKGGQTCSQRTRNRRRSATRKSWGQEAWCWIRWKASALSTHEGGLPYPSFERERPPIVPLWSKRMKLVQRRTRKVTRDSSDLCRGSVVAPVCFDHGLCSDGGLTKPPERAEGGRAEAGIIIFSFSWFSTRMHDALVMVHIAVSALVFVLFPVDAQSAHRLL